MLLRLRAGKLHAALTIRPPPEQTRGLKFETILESNGAKCGAPHFGVTVEDACAEALHMT